MVDRRVHSSQKGNSKGYENDVRTQFIRFGLSFLVTGDYALIQDVLDVKDFIGSIFKGIFNDPPSLIYEIFDGLHQHVLLNKGITKRSKSLFFNTYVLDHISNVYLKYSGINEDTNQVLETKIFGFLHDLLCSSSKGIMYISKPLPLSASKLASPMYISKYLHVPHSRNRPMSRILKSFRPSESEHHQQLVLGILENDIQLRMDYIDWVHVSLEPRWTDKWQKNVQFMIKLMNHETLDLGYIALLSQKEGVHMDKICNSLVPSKSVYRSILNQCLLSNDTKIVNETLSLMCQSFKLLDRIITPLVAVENCLENSLASYIQTNLLKSFSKRIPDLQTVLSLLKQYVESKPDTETEDQDVLMSLQTSIYTIIHYYFSYYPDFFSDVKFDYGRLMPASRNEISIGGQRALVQLLHKVKHRLTWNGKLSGTQKTQIRYMLEFTLDSQDDEIRKSLRSSVVSMLSQTGYFQGCEEDITIWVSMLQSNLLSHFENTLEQLQSNYFAYIDKFNDLKDMNSEEIIRIQKQLNVLNLEHFKICYLLFPALLNYKKIISSFDFQNEWTEYLVKVMVTLIHCKSGYAVYISSILNKSDALYSKLVPYITSLNAKCLNDLEVIPEHLNLENLYDPSREYEDDTMVYIAYTIKHLILVSLRQPNLDTSYTIQSLFDMTQSIVERLDKQYKDVLFDVFFGEHVSELLPYVFNFGAPIQAHMITLLKLFAGKDVAFLFSPLQEQFLHSVNENNDNKYSTGESLLSLFDIMSKKQRRQLFENIFKLDLHNVIVFEFASSLLKKRRYDLSYLNNFEKIKSLVDVEDGLCPFKIDISIFPLLVSLFCLHPQRENMDIYIFKLIVEYLANIQPDKLPNLDLLLETCSEHINTYRSCILSLFINLDTYPITSRLSLLPKDYSITQCLESPLEFPLDPQLTSVLPLLYTRSMKDFSEDIKLLVESYKYLLLSMAYHDNHTFFSKETDNLIMVFLSPLLFLLLKESTDIFDESEHKRIMKQVWKNKKGEWNIYLIQFMHSLIPYQHAQSTRLYRDFIQQFVVNPHDILFNALLDRVNVMELLSKDDVIQYMKLLLKKGFTHHRTFALIHDIVESGFLSKKRSVFGDIHDMILSHPSFLTVLFEGTDPLVKLHLSKTMYRLYEKNQTKVNPKLLNIYMMAYHASSSEIDQYLFNIIQHFERNGVSMTQSGYVWGSLASEYSLDLMINKPERLVLDLKSTSALFFEGKLFDQKQMIRTIKYFPVHRNLREEYSEMDNNIYDISFTLPYVLFACENFELFDCKKFIDIGYLALTIQALSSWDEDIRMVSYAILTSFYTRMEENDFREARQVRLLLNLLQNSLTQTCERLSSFTSSFLSQASFIMIRTDHPLFLILNDFLLSRSHILQDSISILTHYFSSSTNETPTLRQWILKVMYAGIKDESDVLALEKARVIPMFMFHLNGTTSYHETKEREIILSIIEKCFELDPMYRCTINQGLMIWLIQRIMDNISKDIASNQLANPMKENTQLINVMLDSMKRYPVLDSKVVQPQFIQLKKVVGRYLESDELLLKKDEESGVDLRDMYHKMHTMSKILK